MLKRLVLALALALALAMLVIAPLAQADDHAHHARHNMILHGTKEIFASHLVYKVPHNFQVIVRLKLSASVRRAYLAARAAYPEQTFILLLDPVSIGELAGAAQISGPLFRRDAEGVRVDVVPSVVLDRAQFEVVYSDELPLSLAAD